MSIRSYQLGPWEVVQPKVRGKILHIWVILVGSYELKCLMFGYLLNLQREILVTWVRVSLLILFFIEFGYFLDNSDEETRRVLVVWHNSDAFLEFIKNFLGIMLSKHGLSYYIHFSTCFDSLQRNLRELLILIKEGLIILRVFLLIFNNLLNLSLRFHIKESPFSKAWSELEPR